jgi:hypothetical protein
LNQIINILSGKYGHHFIDGKNSTPFQALSILYTLTEGVYAIDGGDVRQAVQKRRESGTAEIL